MATFGALPAFLRTPIGAYMAYRQLEPALVFIEPLDQNIKRNLNHVKRFLKLREKTREVLSLQVTKVTQ